MEGGMLMHCAVLSQEARIDAIESQIAGSMSLEFAARQAFCTSPNAVPHAVSNSQNVAEDEQGESGDIMVITPVRQGLQTPAWGPSWGKVTRSEHFSTISCIASPHGAV